MKAICSIKDLAEKECKEFDYLDGDQRASAFIVKFRNRVYAYRNRCPHTGAELNWLDHQFFDTYRTHLQCSIHAALFRIDDGFCLRGPCIGESLEAISIFVDGDLIYIDTPPISRS